MQLPTPRAGLSMVETKAVKLGTPIPGGDGHLGGCWPTLPTPGHSLAQAHSLGYPLASRLHMDQEQNREVTPHGGGGA